MSQYVSPTPPDEFYRDRNRHHQHSHRNTPLPPKMLLPQAPVPPPSAFTIPAAAAAASTVAASSPVAQATLTVHPPHIHAGQRRDVWVPPPLPPLQQQQQPSRMSVSRVWPVPGNVLDCTMAESAIPVAEPVDERRMRIATENGMHYEPLRTNWLGEYANAKNDLFNIQGGPKFLLAVDVWKPLIRAYFAWFSIPRSQCTKIWGDIVDCLLKLPDGSMDAVFQSWAFGCLCKFHLEDRRMRETASRDEYDPEKPIVIKED